MTSTVRRIASLCALLLAAAWPACVGAAKPATPNIVLIYADDLGYGDLSCYNPEAKAATPRLDRLAQQGMRFTDAHSPSTVCTPSRYGLLTGRMPFRLNYRGVFTGVEGPCLIDSDRLTLPEMLRSRGYATAMFGKWHLGMRFEDSQGRIVGGKRGVEMVRKVDFSRRVQDGPLAHGFDQFFGTACCPTTDWLYAWIDGDRVPTPPTKIRDAQALPQHPYARDCRPGLQADDFDFEAVDLLFLKKSREFLSEHVRRRPDQPFFLYHATQAVHLPSFPAPRFHGDSGAGPHGDFIVELDTIVGELLDTLDSLQVADNTIVIVTSDNGPETLTTIRMREDHQHDGARPWRGMKRDQWEGGHRVPFLLRWPGKTPEGSVCDQPFCQTDVMRTLAAAVGASVPDSAGEDSFNFLPVWKGRSGQPIRPFIVHQTIRLDMAIRKGPWKLLAHQGSGGNNYTRGELTRYALTEEAPNAPGQLYHLKEDPGETHNLYLKQPSVVRELEDLLSRVKESGSSRF